VSIDAIPAELRDRAQWVVWRLEQRRDRDARLKPTKVPYQASAPRSKASTTDARTWGIFEQAIAVRGFDGIGYVFAPDDPYAGVDLDGCVDAEGELHPDAATIVAELDGYREVSPSGVGLHVVIRATLPRGEGRETMDTPWRHEDRHELAVYDRSRDVANNPIGKCDRRRPSARRATTVAASAQ
jgi:putative DNA primase/helicase